MSKNIRVRYRLSLDRPSEDEIGVTLDGIEHNLSIDDAVEVARTILRTADESRKVPA